MAKVTGYDTDKTEIHLDVSIKTITPQVAKQMLKNGHRNRHLSRSRTQLYTDAMRIGNWIVAQPLLFCEDNRLIDGQTRLNSVITANKPASFLVIRGFNAERTFARLDANAPRTLQHWLEYRREPNPAVLATVIAMAMRDDPGTFPTSSPAGGFRIAPLDAMEFFDANPRIRDAMVDAPATITPLAPRSMLVFCFLKFRELDDTLAKAFFVDLLTGSNEGHSDPMFLLRERLKSDLHARKKMSRTEKLALLIIAWNAVREDKTVSNLRWRTTGPGAQKFPEIQ